MTTNAYLVYWCEEGLESVVPITEYEHWDAENTFRVLNDQDPLTNPLTRIIQTMILRAQLNTQRHYELYAVDCEADITGEYIAQMFEDNPQVAADLFRDRGHKLYADRANQNRIKIT